MKKYILIITTFLILFAGIVFWGLSSYFNSLKPVSNDETLKNFEVLSGKNYYSIANELYNQKLIKSKLGYKIYLKLNKPQNELKAGTYKLSESMGIKKIIEVLGDGGVSGLENTVTITFKEGLNIRQMNDIIIKNTNIKENEIYEVLSDTAYLDELINKYWFLTDEIKNEKIYYSLEGYLYPNTYQFKADITIKELIEKLLTETENQLLPYKEEILSDELTIHEIITLASVVELEAKTIDDRKGVAGVFFNRLDNNMNLGSDVTTYYGAKVNMSDRDLYLNEINDNNPYNTRNANMAAKLPVGPICNVSVSSINAVLKPTKSDYYYFVSDKNGKIYFAKNYQEHNSVINTLKGQNLWYEY